MDPNANISPHMNPLPSPEEHESFPIARRLSQELQHDPKLPLGSFGNPVNTSRDDDTLSPYGTKNQSLLTRSGAFRLRNSSGTKYDPAAPYPGTYRSLEGSVHHGGLNANDLPEMDLTAEINQVTGLASARPDTHVPRAFLLDHTKLGRQLDVMENISRTISRHLRDFESQGYNISNISFKKYPGDLGQALESAITITGDPQDAEAMTVREYLSRTWPTTGHKVCKFFRTIPWSMFDNSKTTIIKKAKLAPGVSLALILSREVFDFHMYCNEPSALIDITQQLAWLAAALQPSPVQRAPIACTPSVIAISSTPDPYSAQQICEFEIRCRFEEGGTIIIFPGSCWHAMLNRPVVVGGFPIRRKAKSSLGLEMPLNMMAEFAGSNRIVEFDNKLFIKGYSTMLIATMIIDNMVVWHYCHGKDGKRLSYFDHDVTVDNSIKLHHLEKARHTVGWCEKCMYLAGTTNIKYEVDRTMLPKPSPGFMLEKVSISTGKVIQGGVTFLPGVRDMPAHLTRQGSIPRLRWMSLQHVLFWDEQDKRGWLINGVSALLHLVMGALEHYRTDDFSESFMFDPSELRGANSYTPAAAIQVLTNPQNRVLKIYPDKIKFSSTIIGDVNPETSYFLFDDLVDQFYNILEQMIEYHSHLAGRNGINLKPRLRKHLEGWDFVDLITDQDPLPRVATLPAQGYGWVDFIRSINAIPIFGRGFGHLIFPLPWTCPEWSSLPPQRYLLAASNDDLNKIMDRFGDRHASPWLLTQDLEWRPQPQSMLCPCLSHPRQAAPKQHLEPIQIIRPAKASRRGSKQLNISLPDSGAVVFGHNRTSGFRWSDTTYKQASSKAFKQNSLVTSSSSPHSEAIDASSLSNRTSNNGTFYSAISSASTSTNLSTITNASSAQETSKTSKQKASMIKRLSLRLFNKKGKREQEEEVFIQ